MAKRNNVEVDDDDDDVFDDIDGFDDFEDDDSKENVMDSFDARRRLEKVLEDKALDRLINGDMYDDDMGFFDDDRYDFD